MTTLSKKTFAFWTAIPAGFLVLYLITLNYTCETCKGKSVDFGSQIIGWGDVYSFVGYANVVRDNLVRFRPPFSGSDLLRYPYGFDFSYGHDGGFQALIGGAAAVFLPLALAFNVTILLIILANICVSAFAFRKIALLYNPESTDILYRSLLAGVFYGLCPYVYVRLNAHTNLALVGLMPLVAWTCLQAAEHVKKGFLSGKDVGLIGISLALVSGGSLYYFIFGIIILAAIVSHTAVFHLRAFGASLRGLFLTGAIRSLLLWMAPPAAIFLFFHYGDVIALLTGSLTMPKADKHSPWPVLQVIAGMFVPANAFRGFDALHFPSGGEHLTFMGLSGTYVLACTVLFWKRLRVANILVILGITVLLVLMMSDIIPVFGVKHGETRRLSILFIMLLGIVFSSDGFFEKGKVTVFLGLLILERMILSTHVSPPLNAALYERVRELPGKAVLVVPSARKNQFHSDKIHSIFPYYFGKSVVDGYFHWKAEPSSSTELLTDKRMAFFSCAAGTKPPDPDDLFPYLLSLDIRVIFVDLSQLRGQRNACKGVAEWLRKTDGVRQAFAEPDGAAFEILP